MGKACETCGNIYREPFTIKIKNSEHTFDCFECAIHALAPKCGNCGVAILGHGFQSDNELYCSAHCGRHNGEIGFCDNTIGLVRSGKTYY